MNHKLLISLIFILFTTNLIADEKDVYDFGWLDSDKEVYVLQNRKYRKDGNFYIGGTFGKSLAGAFIDSTRYSLHAGFFFSENWGVELTYTKANGATNATHDAVNEQAGAVAYYRKIDTQTSVMLMWAPFYAKINTFNTVIYYDWLFGLGMSNLTTLDNRNEFDPGPDSDTLTKESFSALTWMTGWRFYLSQSWSLRLDFHATHMNVDMAESSETDTKKRTVSKYDLNFGINFSF